MKKISLVLLASVSLILTSGAATNYAARVVRYEPGLSYAAGFTNASQKCSGPLLKPKIKIESSGIITNGNIANTTKLMPVGLAKSKRRFFLTAVGLL